MSGIASKGSTESVNLRRMTNIGTFRAYLNEYPRNHPRIRQRYDLNGTPIWLR